MPDAERSSGPTDRDWAAFTALDRMTNHWDRPGWRPGRKAFYWYISFRDHDEVRALAEQCQTVLAAPHFDLTAGSDLHMTLNRVAFADEITAGTLRCTANSVRARVAGFGEIRLRVGPLAGSRGALSFSVDPQVRLRELREEVANAMLSDKTASAEAGSAEFRPHVGIGYCNRTIDAMPVIEQVRTLRALPPVDVCISELTLVTLTRHERAYSWDVVEQLPLRASG